MKTYVIFSLDVNSGVHSVIFTETSNSASCSIWRLVHIPSILRHENLFETTVIHLRDAVVLLAYTSSGSGQAVGVTTIDTPGTGK